MNNGLGNLDDLFAGAQADGLTADTIGLVANGLNSMAIGNVGVPLHKLACNEVTLAMNIIDASGSMAPYAADLMRAYNEDYLGAMAGSTAVDEILVSSIIFNDQVEMLHGYVNLPDAPLLDSGRYQPGGSTALYDAVAQGISAMVAYAQHLRQRGVLVRCLLIVYSDGEDNVSKQKVTAVRQAAQDLLQHEIYTLAYVGFQSGGMDEPRLRSLANKIGFPDIIVGGLDHRELRRIFRLMSSSTLRA
jgi:uncharacterized protein with von Willebrand factor type A (vWA) domain